MAFHLLLIVVAFARPEASASSLHVFEYQPRALASNTSLSATLSSACKNPTAVPFLFSVDPIILHGRRGQPRQARGGGNPEGEHADELASPTHEVRLVTSVHDDDLF